MDISESHLVTGASGFLGRQTVELLLRSGEQVIGVDINPFPRNEHAGDFDFVLGDIRDSSKMRPLMNKTKVIHHQAAMVPLAKSRDLFWSVNVEGTKSLATLAKESSVAHFIYTSSSAVYGRYKGSTISLETPKIPMEPYGKSKLLGEQVSREVLSGTDTVLSVVRPRTLLGKSRGGIFQLFFDWIRQSKPIFTIGRGDNNFQFVHVDDFLSAYSIIARNSNGGEFNIGAPEYKSLRENFENLIERANSKSKVVELPKVASTLALAFLEKANLSPLAPYHRKAFHRSFVFDTGTIQNLGWRPKFSSDEAMVQAYYEWKQILDSGKHANGHSFNQRNVSPGMLGLIQQMFGR